jgi:hypothetical protein
MRSEKGKITRDLKSVQCGHLTLFATIQIAAFCSVTAAFCLVTVKLREEREKEDPSPRARIR